MKKVLTALGLLVALFASAQNINPQKVDDWVKEEMISAMTEHREFVSLPNVAINVDDMKKNAAWMKTAFENRGFEVEVLETGSVPVVLAKREVNPKFPTLMFYLHYDGQNIDPTKWDQEDPFDPVIKDENGNRVSYEDITSWKMDWRIYGRAAADDKGPIIMFLNAMDIVNAQKLKLTFNIQVMLDGQEEAGSRGLLSTLEKYKPKYKSDGLVIMDGPIHPSNEPTLTFGCRGVSSATLTIYGAKTPQHSGHFGNYAPNPVFRMAHLLSSMKDEEGRVTIPGFYDGIDINDEIRTVLESVPDDEEAIQARIGIAEADKVGSGYQEALQYPSLNVKGMASGWIGEQTRTIVPEKVTAQIGMRLVAETDGARMLKLLGNYIADQGYYVIDREPTDEERLEHAKIATYQPSRYVNAFRTDVDSSLGMWMTKGITRVFEKDPVRIRTMGGTVPIVPIIDALGVPAIILPLVNMDNNQHSPNENLRVGNMYNGIKTMVGLLTTKGLGG